MIKKIIMTGLLFLWGIFSVYIGITTWKADKAYFSLQSEKNQAEKILLWEDIKKAPYLEKNILGSFSPIFGVYKNEILQIGKKYSYQSSSFRQREMWYFFNTQKSEKAWKKFLETFQTSGKDIRQKIFLIDLGMKIFPEKQRSLLLLAEDTYQIIPEKYFSSDSLDDFMVEKFWNDDSLSRSTYGLLSLLSKISTDEKYCKNILDIKKEFSLQQRIPKKCL